MKKFLLMSAAALLLTANLGATTLGACPGTTNAQASVSDYEALAQSGCMIGDKKFGDFLFADQGLISGIAVINDGGQYGLAFFGSFGAPPTIAPKLAYSVQVMDPNMVISQANFTVPFLNNQGGNIFLTENFYSQVYANPFTSPAPGGTFLGSMPQPTCANGSCLASLAFDPGVTFLYAVKDLSLRASDGNSISFSVFTQSYEQVGNQVPEPGTYALMGAGLIGLAFLRRRKA
ncbi:MAG: PEP-CTERM sorting domain-containing protein [Acidobacteria bacterium]|nr:PEP-CTERM sorting domain-containing protein [Acidobacteriota bacterium]